MSINAYTLAKPAILGMLGDLKTSVLDGAELKLFQNNLGAFTADTVIGDLTEADFTGYSAVTLTAFATPYLEGSTGVIRAPHGLFETASPYTVGNTIYGYWVESGAGDLLFGGLLEDGPVPMAGIGDALLIEPGIKLPSTV